MRDADADLVKQVFDAGRSFEDVGQASFFLLHTHIQKNRGDKFKMIRHMLPLIKLTNDNGKNGSMAQIRFLFCFSFNWSSLIIIFLFAG